MFEELKVNQVTGLFNQLYNLEETLSDCDIKNGFLNVNSIFWAQILNINNIKKMICELKKRHEISSTKLNAVKSNPKIFIDLCKEAINNINSQSLNAPTEFKYLETLQIVCYMYSYLYSLPFELSIYDGYKHNQFSAYELKEKCMMDYFNPYYRFIKYTILPKIDCKRLRILWVKGRPNISSFCLIELIKEINPNVYVVSIENNTEFFSFLKIHSLLKNNHTFFKVFDCVVLSDNSNIYKQIRIALKNNTNLNNINNIIYSTDHGKSIICSTISRQNCDFTYISDKEIKINKTVNIKLFPNNNCYWNKCSFCAINEKYICPTNDWNINATIQYLNHLKNIGIEKFWALDEAIPAKVLEKLSEAIIQNNLNFDWHVRSRIEKEFLENNIPQKLCDSGLKHILFGFESASPRILSLMNKTNQVDSYLSTAENIVKVFNDLNIHIHFPVIIGFPTETEQERQETLDFMSYLEQHYSYFSYNINILNLDVASELYKNFNNYNISSVSYPCSPYDFIGNGVNWECKGKEYFTVKQLENQAIFYMKKQFDWYPSDSLTDILTFYSMWEYSRGQLVTNSNTTHIFYSFSHNKKYQISKNLTFFKDYDGLYCLYNFDNHNCIRGGKVIKEIYESARNSEALTKIIIKIENRQFDFASQLFNDLLRLGFLEPCQ